MMFPAILLASIVQPQVLHVLIHENEVVSAPERKRIQIVRYCSWAKASNSNEGGPVWNS